MFTGRKVSEDLDEAVYSASEKTVKVIVELEPSLNTRAYSQVFSKFSQKGGIITRSLNGGKSAAMEIPAKALASLTNDANIRYISLDRPTEVSGHLETTTGAAMARTWALLLQAR